MKLADIKLICKEFNRDIFTPLGFELSPAWHRRTRAKDIWAYWHDEKHAYYWNTDLLDCPCIRSLIFHEMIHQWQKEYMHESSESIHDRYFNGWQCVAFANNLTLKDEY